MRRIADGRTDLVWDLLAQGTEVSARTPEGATLVQTCAWYGDVSALRFLLDHGAKLDSLGTDLGLNAAAFHGHWRLCEFLLDQGANANVALEDTGETPLHSSLCTPDRSRHDLVVQVLLARGADPNRCTTPHVPTNAFMRDARTKGETPLHRAAAFGTERTIDLLLGAGAKLETRDAHGDTPRAWASWYARPDAILRRLCFGEHRIHPDRIPMSQALLGRPHDPA